LQGANVNVASVNVGRRAPGAQRQVQQRAGGGDGEAAVPSGSGSDELKGEQMVAAAEALCIMALDDDVPTNVMDVLRTGVPAIRQVSKIQIK
jgi:hypothetical protein